MKKNKKQQNLDNLDETYVQDMMNMYGVSREQAIKTLGLLRAKGV